MFFYRIGVQVLVMPTLRHFDVCKNFKSVAPVATFVLFCSILAYISWLVFQQL